MASTQSQIAALLDSQSQAVRAKNVDRLMSLYSPDIIYYDVVPPLQYVGSAALRGRFSQWFDGYNGAIDMQTQDIHVLASDDFAVACRFSRVSGTLKSGHEVGSWVRATSTCQRSDRGWVITHEHVSLPVDLMSGSAAKDLVP